MSDYIKREDAERAIQQYHDNMLRNFKSNYYAEKAQVENCLGLIKDIPSADVVEVVRCKDCKRWKDEQKMIDLVKDKMVAPCDFNERDSFEDDFCSYGEREDV